MAPDDPFSRGRNGCVATDGQANAEREETLKAGENLWMQPDTAGSRIKSIKEVSTNSFTDRSTRRKPVIPLHHDRLREALGDIAAIGFLRHLKDQLLHGVTHSLLSKLNQPRTSFAMLHHSFASLRLCAS